MNILYWMMKWWSIQKLYMMLQHLSIHEWNGRHLFPRTFVCDNRKRPGKYGKIRKNPVMTGKIRVQSLWVHFNLQKPSGHSHTSTHSHTIATHSTHDDKDLHSHMTTRTSTHSHTYATMTTPRGTGHLFVTGKNPVLTGKYAQMTGFFRHLTGKFHVQSLWARTSILHVKWRLFGRVFPSSWPGLFPSPPTNIQSHFHSEKFAHFHTSTTGLLKNFV